MAKLPVNLSGQGGLGPNFYGDDDMVTPQPHLRYEGQDGQMANGLFNPFLRKGYLSPCTSSLTTITPSSALTQVLASVQHDSVNNDVYFGERANVIYKAVGLNDTTLDKQIETDANTVIHDLEIYEINSIRKLFYTYVTDEVFLRTDSILITDWFSLALRLVPQSTNNPQVIVSEQRNSSATTQTDSITVPNDSDMAGIVIVSTVGGTTSGVTFGGNAMVNAGTYTSLQSGVTVEHTAWYYKGIIAGAQDVVVSKTGTSSTTILAINNAATVAIANLTPTHGTSNLIRGVLDVADDSAYLQYTFSTPTNWNVTGASAGGTYDPTTQTGAAQFAYRIGNDGTKLYAAGGSNIIYQYTLSTAWDITTATYDTVSYDHTAIISGTLKTIRFSSDGAKMYLHEFSEEEIFQYTLSTPWDISTATYDTVSFVPGGDITNLDSFVFNSTGTALYATVRRSAEYNPRWIYQYTLATPWDIDTISYSGNRFDLSSSYSFTAIDIDLGNDDALVYFDIFSPANLYTIYRWKFDELDPGNIAKLSNTGDFLALGNADSNFQMEPIGTRLTKRNNSTAVLGEYDFVQGLNGSLNSSQSIVEVFNSSGKSHLTSYTEVVPRLLQCGIAQLPVFGIYDNNWLTETLQTFESSASTYNFMRSADNGFLYIFAQNKVHKVDGTRTGGLNGVITPQVLVFPEYFTITDAVDYRSNMYMVVHQTVVDITDSTSNNYAVPCGVYVWNRKSTVVSVNDYFTIEGVREIKKIYVAPDGSLRLIVISSSGLTQIRQFTGSTFQVLKELGIGAYPVYPDSLDINNNKATWIAPDGNIYCHGAIRTGMPDILTKLIQLKAPGDTTVDLAENIISGALFYGSSPQTASTGFRSDKQPLVFCYNDGAYKIRKAYPFDLTDGANANQVPVQGDVYTQVLNLGSLCQVNYIHLVMETTGTASSTTIGTVKIYRDAGTTPINTTLITAKDVARGFKYIKIGKTDVHSLQIEIEWATATGTLANQFRPAYAIVDYEPTTKYK